MTAADLDHYLSWRLALWCERQCLEAERRLSIAELLEILTRGDHGHRPAAR